MTEPLIVSTQGFYSCDLGNDAVFEREPRFIGNGYMAGEAPHGLTTVYGDPVSAEVRVYWRDPDNPLAQDVLVGLTTSAPDGTWRITGLNPDLQYVVRGRKAGYDDVSVVGAVPTRTDVVTAAGSFVTNTDKNGVDGTVLIEGGLPPYAVSQVLPLPFGLEPVIDGHELTIPGTSDDGGLWDSLLRVTASNGVFVDVPVEVEIIAKSDPHWDGVVALLHFDGDLKDETGAVWSSTGAVNFDGDGIFDKCASFSGSPADRCTRAIPSLGNGDFTIEFFAKFNSRSVQSNFIEILNSSGIHPYGRLTIYQASSSLRVFSAGVHIYTTTPIGWFHCAVVRSGGIVNMYVEGTKVGADWATAKDFDQTVLNIGGSFGTNSMDGSLDELRITKGVARYTANFVPPDKPFLNR